MKPNNHNKNDRYYIDDLLEAAGEGEVEPGDQIVFEMPSFCSGDYIAIVYLDETNYPYILKTKNYFEGCRDWSVKRQNKKPKLPLTKEEIRERVLSQVHFAPGWSPEELKEKAQNRITFASDWAPLPPVYNSLQEVVDALNKRIPTHLEEKAIVCGLWDSGYVAVIDICGICLWDSEIPQVLIRDIEQGATYNDIFDHCLRQLRQYAEYFGGIADDSWNFEKYK
jgi:hypothetical protein